MEHNGGLDKFLLKARPTELSTRALKLKRDIEKAQADVDAKYAELSKQYGLSVELLRQQLPPLRLRHDLKLAAAQAVVVDSAKRK